MKMVVCASVLQKMEVSETPGHMTAAITREDEQLDVDIDKTASSRGDCVKITINRMYISHVMFVKMHQAVHRREKVKRVSFHVRRFNLFSST